MIGGEHNPLFPDKESRLLEIWDQMQRLQTDFCFNQELGVFYQCPQWIEAQHVLDVGTGTGYYMGQLAKKFPDKRYLGIDSSAPLLARALHRFSTWKTLDTAFHEASVETFSTGEKFDFVLLRLLLQHVTSISDALEAATKLTASGGVVLVVDALDDERFFCPPAMEFRNFFNAYTSNQISQGRNRDVGKAVRNWVENSSDWSVSRSHRLVIPSTVDGNFDLFAENYRLFIDLVEMSGELEYRYDDARQKWKDWCAIEGAYMQVGLELILLEKG